VNLKVQRRLRNCKRRIRRRLRPKQGPEQRRRVFRDRNVHDEIAARARGLHAAGPGARQPHATRPGIVVSVETEGNDQGPRPETRRADGTQLRVVFDGAGKVQGKVYILATVTREPSLAERGREWLRRVWP
jgi:hypothetical protein